MFVIFVYFLALPCIYFDLIALVTRSLTSKSSVFLVSAFNIDEEYPIVITNKFDHADAHFGASVLLLPSLSHAQSDNSESGITGWVMIGAPKANSTNLNHTNIYQPGVIWRCPLGQLNPDKACEVVEIDPTGEYDPKHRANPYQDRKDGGWLGGGMFVGDSDRFVTCASRWTNKKFTDLYLVNGICLWLPKKTLQTDTTDAEWPWLAPDFSYRLCPLLNTTKQTYTLGPKDNPNRTIYNWANGQFGFSLHLTAKNELVAGAVGILDWSGSVVYYRDSDHPRPSFKRYNAQEGSPEFSEVLVARWQEPTDLLENADYFGYSVTSGNFFHPGKSNNKTQIAAGAPRSSRLSGKVIVFTLKELEGSRSVAKVEPLIEFLEGSETNKGNHYGSYFGHSIVALDMNSDGLDDLLVGAPLYGTSVRFKRNIPKSGDFMEQSTSEGQSSRVTMKSGDEGCVFVYFSTGDDFIRTPQALCGDKIPGARFGMAISSLRDINFDGFNDMAVGAPYENEGHGAVYIYHGGAHFVMLAQKLQPELIDQKIQTFGWSLSLAEDIDKNGYPDLAVGAYETNQVVIFRTIPIVHFRPTLNSSIPKLLYSTRKFNLTTCISYDGHGLMANVLEIYVKLTVGVEPEGKRLAALVQDDNVFRRGSSEIFNVTQSNELPPALVLEGQLMVSTVRLLNFHHYALTCYNFSAVRIGTDDGFTRSVPITMEYWMHGHDQDTGSVKPLFYEITSKNSSSQKSFANATSSHSKFSDFLHRKRPMPAGNTFGVETMILPVGTICEADGNPECHANLTISAWLVDQRTKKIYNAQNPFVLGLTNTVTLKVELANHKETAKLPVILQLSWPQPPTVRRDPPKCNSTSRKSRPKIAYDKYTCSIRKPIKEHQKEVIEIELDMSRVYGTQGMRNMNIFIEANTTSELVQEAKLNLSIPLLTRMKPLHFNQSRHEMGYSRRNTSLPTFGIPQTYEIGLSGPSPASFLVIEFNIPAKIIMKGRTLELIEFKKPVITYDGEMDCHTESGGFIDEEQIETVIAENDIGRNSWKAAKRVTRSVFAALLTQNAPQKHGFPEDPETILKVHCNNGSPSYLISVTCVRVSCRASQFTPTKKAIVEFKLKVFSQAVALLLDPDNHGTEISSLWIESMGSVRTMDSNKKTFGIAGTLTFTSQVEIPPPYQLPAWILIVSVAGGLLLFTILTILLRKCGFFRRSKRDLLLELRRGNAEFERRRLPASNPSTTSTARVSTSSSSRRQDRRPSTASSRGSAGSHVRVGRKRSFKTNFGEVERGGNILAVPVPATMPVVGESCSSPSTSARQREIPGAVDLTELRRLYAYADDDELY